MTHLLRGPELEVPAGFVVLSIEVLGARVRADEEVGRADRRHVSVVENVVPAFDGHQRGDEQPGFGGRELINLAAGLDALQGKADAAYLSSCDVPFLRPAFVRRLIHLLGDHAVCVPRVGDYHHPLAAVYRLEVADAVARLLAEDRLRPFFLFEAVPTRVVGEAELADVDPTFQTLRNLNTPEDYEAALREVGG